MLAHHFDTVCDQGGSKGLTKRSVEAIYNYNDQGPTDIDFLVPMPIILREKIRLRFNLPIKKKKKHIKRSF